LNQLPEGAAERKARPLVSGCVDYFSAALAEVSLLSVLGNEQHNPGEPMHHARGKSTDHADCIMRHLVDRGSHYEVTIKGVTHKIRHSTAVAWRALALLQEELEAAGAPLARGARLPEKETKPGLEPGLYEVDPSGDVWFTPVHDARPKTTLLIYGLGPNALTHE
jgi:hypothetical protein